MVERYARKAKTDVALRAQSSKDKKDNGKWNGHKGRDDYNNSDGTNYQQEGSS